MKILKFFSAMLFVTFCCTMAAQGQVMMLKFTSMVYGNHVDIDSVRVTNLTHPGDTVLNWPDTTLILGYVGINEPLPGRLSGFALRFSSANPVVDQAYIQLVLLADGKVLLRITDVSGRVIQEINQHFSSGVHLLRYYPFKQGISIISAWYESEVRSLKLIYTGTESGGNKLIYEGLQNLNPAPKSVSSTLPFLFYPGDTLLLRGWYNGKSTILYTAPMTSKDYAFLFGMNYPCPGLAQFFYGGQIYNTVQIGSQCWMKENLNIGKKVNSIALPYTYHSDMHNDGKIEKYCFNNDSVNCTVYGGIYEWDEVMQYMYTPGSRGICAEGWHIPTNEEWCAMASYVDSTVNCTLGNSGTTIANKLKETGTAHWYSFNLNATNESGFTTLAASYRHPVGEWPVNIAKMRANFWTSTNSNASSAKSYSMSYYYSTIGIGSSQKLTGESVRCIKDY